MLHITIPEQELFDEENGRFITTPKVELALEHSLVSISKWEAKWCKPFLSNNDRNQKTDEETRDYIRCMTLTQNVDPEVYNYLSAENYKEISEYIDSPSTATWFSEDVIKNKSNGVNETITSELIYYWMIALNIPVEFQKWHLNRLLTLIRVCNIKNQPPKKMSKSAIMSRNAALNQQRRAKLHSRG